jgi:hypothetical protein
MLVDDMIILGEKDDCKQKLSIKLQNIILLQ